MQEKKGLAEYYLEIERPFDPERDREETDLERDLERLEDLALGDLLLWKRYQ